MKIVKGILYHIVHIVWALPTFVFGLFVALFMLLTKHKPHRFGLTIYFVSRSMKGCGFAAGPFFVLSGDCADNLQMKQHEHGHGLQALWWGPLMAFVVCIPSVIRFWYRNRRDARWAKRYNKQIITREQYLDYILSRKPYSSIWFERQADELGKKYFSEG